jgi:large repetitive protein
MLARRTRGARRRRGVVLILVLAMLGLLALIGVTFATFANQAKIGAEYTAQSVQATSADQVIAFALDQLINDSSNYKSAIRGHSLLRDMYGRDFYQDPIDGLVKPYQNIHLAGLPEPNGQPLTVTGATIVAAPLLSGQSTYVITTNIPTDLNRPLIQQMPQLHGANFTGNVLRLQQWLLDATNGRFSPIRQVQRPDRLAQTFEIVSDNRTGQFHIFTLTFADQGTTATGTTLTPPSTLAFVQPDSPAAFTPPPGQTMANIFEVDGRYMRGFNGSGQDRMAYIDGNGVAQAPRVLVRDSFNGFTYDRPASAYGNFLYNRLSLAPSTSFAPLDASVPTTVQIAQPQGLNDPNDPPFIGVDQTGANVVITPPQADEDYDAADNENWFLALVTADKQVVIPSFHRPGNIIYNPLNATAENDWISTSLQSQSKFLRPRQQDHPKSGSTFAPLLPDPVTGKIQYDVDNDGDGTPDSVWVDLGYPVQRDPSGKLYKPLFAFMVQGLNGRLPLNTAGNLNKRSAQPQPFPIPPLTSVLVNGTSYPTFIVPAGGIPRVQNADLTLSLAPGHASHLGYSPNEINPKYALAPAVGIAPASGQIPLQTLLQGNFVNSSTAIEGRWGEAGILFASNGTLFPRAGRSYYPNNVTRKFDEFDTNFDGLDFYPKGTPGNPPYPETADLLDPANRTLLPVERLRRFVTPVDISGNGKLMPFNTVATPIFPLDPTGSLDFGLGSDAKGRVGYQLYYRPPGISNWASDYVDLVTNPLTGASTSVLNILHGYESQRHGLGSNNDVMGMVPSDSGDPTAMPVVTPGMSVPSLSSTVNSNDLISSLATPTPLFDPTTGKLDNTRVIGMFPDGSLSLSDAAQMDLYNKTTYDSPFSPADQEWLSRHGDIDDAGLAQRLPNLLPQILAANNARASIARNLFTVESWDLNTWAAPSTSMGLGFGSPRVTSTLSDTSPLRFANVANLPSLVHGSKRMNLNLPLPPSNRSDEPVRQKYVRELYQLFKCVLAPPDGASLTAVQLAAIGQFAVNVVDFRDPDATMTAFANYDLTYQPAITASTAVTSGGTPQTVVTQAESVMRPDPTVANNNPVIQWGMEHNPIAFSEILGYTFTRNQGGMATPTPRLFVELVNTLTKDFGATGNGKASDLDLNAWGMIITQDDPTATPPMDTTTAPIERPNIVTGQLTKSTIDGYFVPLAGSGVGGPGSATPATVAPLATPVRAMNAAGGANYYTMSNYINGANPQSINIQTAIESGLILNGPPATITAVNFSIDGRINDELINQIPLAASTTSSTSPPQYYWIHLLRPANPNAGADWLAANPGDTTGAENALALEPKVVVDSMRFPYFVANGAVTVVDAQNTTVTPDTSAIYSVKRKQPYRGGHFIPRTDNVATPTSNNLTVNTNIYPNPNPNAYGFTEQTAPSTTGGAPVTLEGNYIGKVSGTNQAMRITGPIFHSLDSPGSGNDNWDYFPFHDRDFQSLAELFLVPACPPGLFTKQFVELPDPLAFNPTGTPLGDLPPASVDPASGMPVPPTTPYYYNPVFSVTNPPTTAVYSSAPIANWGNTVFGVKTVPDPAAFPYLAEAFHYSSGTKSGWYKILEFLEIPSNSVGYVGPVAAGQNADWARRDLRAGALNLNLITEEEVLFGLLDDPRANSRSAFLHTQDSMGNLIYNGSTIGYNNYYLPPPGLAPTLPVGVGGIPRVATAIYANGMPSFTIPAVDVGAIDYTTTPPTVAHDRGYPAVTGFDSQMKAAFADFIKMRDGGSGLVYSPFSQSAPLWGDPTGTIFAAASFPVAMPAKPFRSLASADINDTVLRPARLQAFQYLNQQITKTDGTNASGGYYDMGVYPGWLTPRTPPRRLFQVPDADPNVIFAAPYGRQDLASERNTGNYILSPTVEPLLPAPQILAAAPNDHIFLSGKNAGLFMSTNNLGVPAARGFLGGSTVAVGTPVADHRWHPAYRTEMLSKVMNNSTTRTHQYAVWLTVGFFEVVKEGNPQMANVRDPVTNVSLAVDQLGNELNAAVGKNVRYRSYFLIDRSTATGFNPNDPGDYRSLITFSRRIE